MAEWFKAPVLKTGRGFTLLRGFESHPFRSRAVSFRFLRDYKRAVLEEINLRNPEALRKVRDESANGMAVVASVRQLEIMQNGDELEHRTVSGRAPALPSFSRTRRR